MIALVQAGLRRPGMSGMELMARMHGLDPATNRRFHDPGRRPRRHLGLVVVHVLPGHLLPGAAVPRGGT